MLILLVDKKGYVLGSLLIENAFYLKSDLTINNKALKIKAKGLVEGIVLSVTTDEEYRLIGRRKEIYVTAHPTPIETFYHNLGAYKLFPIEALKIDAGGNTIIPHREAFVTLDIPREDTGE